MALMAALADTQEAYDSLMERRDNVQDLYLLLAANRISISDHARASHVMLTSNAARMKAAIQDVEENAEANTNRFSKEVASAIPKLRKYAAACLQQRPC